jgi:hypothetical protein
MLAIGYRVEVRGQVFDNSGTGSGGDPGQVATTVVAVYEIVTPDRLRAALDKQIRGLKDAVQETIRIQETNTERIDAITDRLANSADPLDLSEVAAARNKQSEVSRSLREFARRFESIGRHYEFNPLETQEGRPQGRKIAAVLTILRIVGLTVEEAAPLGAMISDELPAAARKRGTEGRTEQNKILKRILGALKLPPDDVRLSEDLRREMSDISRDLSIAGASAVTFARLDRLLATDEMPRNEAIALLEQSAAASEVTRSYLQIVEQLLAEWVDFNDVERRAIALRATQEEILRWLREIAAASGGTPPGTSPSPDGE